MSKAILVLLEMPEKCLRCDFGFDQGDTAYCSRLEKSVERTDHRSGCCPLRLMPKKEPPTIMNDEYDDGYVTGWNRCIDQIERRTE